MTRGEPRAPRPDWGPGWYDLACTDCGAGWVGPAHETCGYCQLRLEKMTAHQAELLLEPELGDPDDQRYDDTVKAWIGRLARGVEAELITVDEARTAIARHRRQETAP